MVTITLIGEHQAKEGEEFVYCGPLTECRDCKLKAVCFNLEPGTAYRIKELRDVTHDCRIHEDGVRVVEVERIHMRCAVSSKLAIEGSTITLGEGNCDNLGCNNFRLCNPTWVSKRPKQKVISIHGDLNCPDDKKMIEVELE